MPHVTRALALLLMLAPAAAAQEPSTRAEEIAIRQAEKAGNTQPYRRNWFEKKLLSIEEAGGFNVQSGFFVTFGDIKSGSSIALGPGYGKAFGNGGMVVAKGAYSIRSFKLLQVSAQSAPLAGGRVLFGGRARWQDAPTLALYSLGHASPEARTDYGETKTELSAHTLLRPVRLLRFGAGAAYERYDTEPAESPSVGGVLFTPITHPGIGDDPDYAHSFVMAAIDSRDGLTYSRRGSLLQATLHDYRQRSDGPYSFQRVDGVAQQLIPILHGNWVIDLSVRASTTSVGDGDAVPFFLMPDLGGSAKLRGFSNYRFRDRHSILFTAEYRWYVQEYADMALFYDAGKVAARRSDLDFDGLKSNFGIGLRFHTPRATVLRLEVARSNEGLRLIFAFGGVVE
jgi:hypothetical protein